MQVHLLCALHGRRYTSASILTNTTTTTTSCRKITTTLITQQRRIIRRRLPPLVSSYNKSATTTTTTTTTLGHKNAGGAITTTTTIQLEQNTRRQRYHTTTQSSSWERNTNSRNLHSSSLLGAPMQAAQHHHHHTDDHEEEEEQDEEVIRFAKSNLANLMSDVVDNNTNTNRSSWLDDQWDMEEPDNNNDDDYYYSSWEEFNKEQNDGGESDDNEANTNHDFTTTTTTPQHLANNNNNETTTTTTQTPALPRKRLPHEKVTPRNMADLLSHFDPQNPPPPDASLSDIQLWLECESQRESVLRYEKVMEDARARKDYASLTTMQKQLLHWYGPLRDAIEEEQREFLLGKEVAMACRRNNNDEQLSSSDNKDTLAEKEEEGETTTTTTTTTKTKKKSGKGSYGPFLCTLQAEKLAVITAHEATMVALHLGENTRLATMAKKIGDAIEAEVHVQRALRQRFEERKLYNKLRKKEEEEEEENKEEGNEMNATDDKDEKKVETKNDKSTQKKQENNNNDTLNSVDPWMYGGSHLQTFIDESNRFDPGRKARLRIATANRRALALLNSEEEWTEAEKVKLGAALVHILLNHTKIHLNNNNNNNNNNDTSKKEEPAFTYEQKWVAKNKRVGHVLIHPKFYKLMVEDKFESFAGFTSRHQPMVLPPRDWVGPEDGGYSALKIELMRTHGCQVQKDAIQQADLSTVFDGLNVLGRVPWVINKQILSVAQRCWNEGVALGDIPSQEDFDVPPMPLKPEKPLDWADTAEYKASEGYKAAVAEFRAYREGAMKHRRIHQKNMDLNSLRCSAMLKLDQAEKFKEFQEIFFPYNMDFRGRAYPVPPHLSNVGSDLCRGMLTFSTSKPLGPRGLYWLKVHLANLAGADKMSFDDRAAFTEKNMESVRAAVTDPFGEDRWWMGLDDPFQGLATCHEIVNAIDSGEPESYECSLPVHMDGSCNGLQHYAALGRDRVGGRAVNLCNDNEPQDVYIGVMEEVIRRVAEEAAKDLDLDESKSHEWTKADRTAWKNNKAAKLVNGLIDRGVVKRTVMTSVYGVTYIGARTQIQEKIEEKLEGKGYDIDEIESEVHSACGYLATMTMDVMGTLFTGARQTMDWLATCARLISQQGQPVAWLSPIGVPAVQPYRQNKPYTIYTLVQKVVLTNNSDNLPIHKSRQVSAFPPNYVHSLDSSHMLLTALEMDRRGLTFSAVHDSFWTHACDIDEMNGVLRDCFVDLYDQPLLEELKRTWELRYPTLNFPDIPERGSLDLDEVKSAKYFFQ